MSDWRLSRCSIESERKCEPRSLVVKKTIQKTYIDYIVIYCYTESPSLSKYFGHMLEPGSANLLAFLCVCMDVRTAKKA